MRKTTSTIVSSSKFTKRFSPGRQRLLFALLTFSSLTSGSAALAAGGSLPTGGHFVGGNGAITQSGNHLSVSQTSQTGVINWQSFSIGKGDSVMIANGRGATLNRVTGGNISTIAGSLRSTGSVYVVNQAGIVVGPSGKVVTNGTFVASTRDVSNATFMAGGNVDLSGSSSGTVVNQGSITSTNGDVVLVGKSVSNSGSVSAAKGNASLAAGDNVLLQASGDDAVLVESGSGNVGNTGTVEAAQVALNAAGGNVYALATNNGGIIRATGTATKDGHVYLTAGDDLTVKSSVAATNADGSGGTIVATASTVRIGAAARITADGQTDGGTIFIGGKGHVGAKAAGLSNRPVANAKITAVARGAVISADAGTKGNGGTVAIWSNDLTSYAGRVDARGGSSSGHGGYVEVSGEQKLNFIGRVTTMARHGAIGTLLLDPQDVTIYSSSDTNFIADPASFTDSPSASFILNTTVDSMLASNNVTISTSGGSGATGNIHFGTNGNAFTNAAPIYWNAATSLTLNAAGEIDTPGGNPSSATSGFNPSSPSTLINSQKGGAITLMAGGSGVNNVVPNQGDAISLTSTILGSGGAINLISTAPTIRIEIGQNDGITNTTAFGSGTITLQADEIRLGVGSGPDGFLTTPLGEVDLVPTSMGKPVVVGDIDTQGEYGNLDNTTLIRAEDVINITANLLVIGSANASSLTIETVNRAGESANLGFPVIDAAFVKNLELVSSGAVTQDANTPIIVNDPGGTLAYGTGGLAVQAGGAITLNNPYNSVGTIAFMQTGTTGGAIAFTRQGDQAASGVGLTVGTVGDISGITTAGSSSSVTISVNETMANPAVLDPDSQVSSVAVGGISISQTAGSTNAIATTALDLEGVASSFTLNNTSNSVSRVSGNVSSVFLYDSTALTQTNGTTLTATGTGTGSTNAAVQIVDASAITLNTGSSISDASGGDIQLETNTQFSSSATDANTLSATGGGVWRVYSQSPLTTGESKGALAENYIEYDAANSNTSPFTATIDGTGNGFLYTYQPTVTATVTATRAYNGTTTAASGILVLSPSTGEVAGDTVTLTTTANGTFNSKNVAMATTVSVGGVSIVSETANSGTVQVYNYLVNPSATGAGTITPIPLTITANDASKTYGQTLTFDGTEFTNGSGQLIGSENVTSVTLTSLGAPATANAGSYAITPSAAVGSNGFLASNYTIDYVTGNLTVAKAALTFTPKAVSVTYNGNTLNNTTYSDTLGNYTINGFQNSDTSSNSGLTLTGSMAFNGSTGTAVKNAGTYSQAAGTLSLTSTNYTLTFTNPVPHNYVITPAALTVTPNAVSVAYNGTTLNNTTYSDNTGNYAITGFLGSDTLNNSGIVLTGSMAFNGSTGTAVKNVATYSQAVGTLGLTSTNGNYSLSFSNPTPHNYVITPLAITITAGDQTKTYGQTATLGTTDFTVGSGLVSGETITSVMLTSTGTPATANVGAYNIAGAGATGSGGFLASNYAITYAPGTLTVNPAVLTVTPVAVSRPYDGTTLNNTSYSDNTGNYTFSGFVNGQNLTSAGIALMGSMAFDGSTTTVVKNAATYTQGVGTLSLSSDHGNYTLNFSNPTPNNYVITPMAITIANLTGTRVYDGDTDADASILTLEHIAAGDQVTVTGTGVLASKNVGVEQIVNLGTLTLHGADAGNYTLTGGLSKDFVTVTPATLTVSAVTQTKVFDGTVTSTGMPTVAGLQTGDSIIGALMQTYDSKNVLGTNGSTLTAAHDISVSDGDGGHDYIIVYKTAQGTITPEDITISATSQTKVYDGTTTSTETPIITAGGLVAGDTLTGLSQAYNSKNVLGTNGSTLTVNPNYVLTDASDYAVTLKTAPGTITPLVITATGTRVYNGTPDVDGSILTITDLIPGDDISLTGTGTSSSPHVGTHDITGGDLTITGPGAGNYTLTGGTETVKITPFAVVLTGTRVYDGQTDGDSAILSVTNAFAGDTVTVASGTSTIVSRNVGNEGITDFGTLTLGGASAGDYTLVGARGNVIVTPEMLTVTAVPGTKTYDGTPTSTGTPIVTSGTIFGPDTGNFIQIYNTQHAGTGLTLTPSGTVNDGNGGNNYIVTYVPVTSGVINPLPIIVYGTRVFDSQTDANSGILMVTNLVGTDMVTLSGTGVLQSPAVGLEPIVGFTGLTLGGASAGDYTLVGAIGDVQVTPEAPAYNPSLQVPDQTASGNGTQVTFSAFAGGLVTLAPQQNGVVTGTIATIDGTDYQPDAQLGCTLGAAGCIQNGVAPTTTGAPPQ